MKKTFKLSPLTGIYVPLALLACCVPATKVNAFQTETKVAEKEQAAADEKAKPEVAEQSEDVEQDDDAKEAKTTEPSKSLADQVQELSDEFDSKLEAWQKKLRSAKTRAAMMAIAKDRPNSGYAEKFLELYEANPTDKDASLAIFEALRTADTRTKTKVSKMLLESIEEHQETVRESYLTLAKFGSRSAKTPAAKKVLEIAKAEQDDKAAIELLKPLMGAAMLRTPSIVKEASELTWERIKAKPESADFETLISVGMNCDAEASSSAFAVISKDYLDHEDLPKTLASVPRRANVGFETLLKEIIENGEGDLRLQAVISMSQYSQVRDRGLILSKLSDEKLAAREKEEKTILEVLKTAEGDSPLHEKAQEQLFILTKLAPGAEAMDIVGTDLEGEEFKLSDYRGKVVFLDFWGDW